MRVDDTDMANDIGEFLTSRHVAGPRREEVASLAGVSIDSYRRPSGPTPPDRPRQRGEDHGASLPGTHRRLGQQAVPTMEHLESQLAAADVTLSGDVLDRIDAINPPGVTINPADNGWTAQSLQPAGRRR